MYTVTYKRKKAIKCICHKIVYFRLYARVLLLSIIIRGTLENARITQINQLLFENSYQLRWIFSFVDTN